MPGEPLDGQHVLAGVKQGGHEGAPQVMQREGLDARLFLPAPEDVGDRLAAEGGCLDFTGLSDGTEQRAGGGAYVLQPVVDQPATAFGQVDGALFAVLAVDDERAVFRVVVVDGEPYQLGAPEAAAVEDREDGGVAGALGGVVCRADLEQALDLVGLQRPAAEQGGGADGSTSAARW